MIHIHWGNHTGGTRNYRAGEYDTCEYFTFVVGVPIYLSFQSCFHVIIDRPSARREMLREFALNFLDLPDLPRRTALPLRPLPTLKWMWFYYYLLVFLGIATIPSVAYLLMNMLFNRMPNGADNFVYISCWSISIAFVVALVAYLLVRRPSRRQARIRGVVASRLGPFSDPAEWAEQLVYRVVPAFGVAVATGDELIRKAEGLVKQGHYEDALAVARLALALLQPPLDGPLSERAEEITEDCLHASGAAHE
jgi:hypothetical protein